MKKNSRKIKYFILAIAVIAVMVLVAGSFTACGLDFGDSSGAEELSVGSDAGDSAQEKGDAAAGWQAESLKELGVPAYSGRPYAIVNGNEPEFKADAIFGSAASGEKNSSAAGSNKNGSTASGAKNSSASGSNKNGSTASGEKNGSTASGSSGGSSGTSQYSEKKLIKKAQAKSFEKYGKLDRQGRCTGAVASLSGDTQPGDYEERGDISEVHPSGWRSGQGWERCHLIGWQLCAENANARNLITGTHYMNVSGMLPFENQVDDYIERSGNHVLYEVTPVYNGKNAVASGVHMQAKSVEDNGRGILFNVYCYNVSPGNTINYKTGEVTAGSSTSGSGADSSTSGSGAGSSTSGSGAGSGNYKRKYVVNTNSGKFHYPSCSGAKMISDKNRWVVNAARKTLINKGYEPCGLCEP